MVMSRSALRLFMGLVAFYGLWQLWKSSSPSMSSSISSSGMEEQIQDDSFPPQQQDAAGPFDGHPVEGDHTGDSDAGTGNTDVAQMDTPKFIEETQNLVFQSEEQRKTLVAWKEEDYLEMETRMGMKPQTLPRSKDNYFSALRSHLHRYFSGSTISDELSLMLDRFEQRDMRLENMALRVVSTDKEGPEGVPEGFEIWQDILKEGWSVDVLDDQAMDDKVMEYTKGKGGEGGEGKGGQRIREIWEKLDFAVLKSDLLRYLVLLHEGGIYTDSDTVPRAHPLDWGKPASDILDSMLSMLDGSLSFLRRLNTHLTSGDKSRYSKGHTTNPTIQNPDISLIIAIEDNRWDEPGPKEWVGGQQIPYRRISICQWTMMSKRLHPVLLDVVGMALGNLEEWLKDESRGKKSVPQLTGPAVFTDAVFRYLLVQYGISPMDFLKLRIRQANRVGDMVLYGPGSFGPMYKTRRDHVEGDVTMPVGHMFKGRWIKQGWD